MAMPSGNVEKMQFSRGCGGGNDIHYGQQWYVDERDRFIGWIRSEFAAVNAIIDALCNHLRDIGHPGDYDMVVGAIQQRRINWNQVLLMQQYFSVSEVVNALQQVTWRRQQRYREPVKAGAKEFTKFGQGFRQWQRFETAKEGYSSGVDSYGHDANSVVTGGAEKGAHITEKNEELKFGGKVGTTDDKSLAFDREKKDAITKHQPDGISSIPGNCEGSLSRSEAKTVGLNDGCSSNSRGNDSHSTQNQHQSQNPSTKGKTFTGTEMFEGNMVNVAEGLKLYEDLFDSTDVSKLVSLVNDMRVAGKRRQLQGSQTYVSRRPMKGRGREMVQLGVPLVDAPSSDVDNVMRPSKDKNVESIPSLFEDIIERMTALQVMTVKPDACIVDFYTEGDHSQPYHWPTWFGRPVYMLFLTECDMTFGRVIGADHPGDYKGAFKLSLVPGSLLVMQGKSTDFAKYAIPSIRKERILVTFTKFQPKKSLPVDAQRLASPTSHWAPPTIRWPNHARHQSGPKHYAAISTTGVLPAPSIRPQIQAPNGMQPLFVPAPVAAPMPFPAPVPVPVTIQPGSAGWTATPPMHPTPRIPVPGTGVFLPPSGSGNSSQHLPCTLTEVNPSVETSTIVDKENGKSNHKDTRASPKGKMVGKMHRQECKGKADGTEVEQGVDKEVESNDKDMTSH
ncbi:hypothetical protein RIF29_15051 [Crotalaria pallida]|uniref:Uncharacterized protein n=1 Tax=Crotalaria pallida TaxID=3830 RepID=A0AAN9IC98_CROPI